MMTSINKPFLNIVFLIIFLFLTGTRPASAATDALALQGQFEQLNSQGENSGSNALGTWQFAAYASATSRLADCEYRLFE